MRDPPGSHKPGKCQLIGMVNKCEAVIKIVNYNKRKWLDLSRLNQKVLDAGGTLGDYVSRDPHASRSIADT